jgi:hypothetical protein
MQFLHAPEIQILTSGEITRNRQYYTTETQKCTKYLKSILLFVGCSASNQSKKLYVVQSIEL